jgi:hypothetical protein
MPTAANARLDYEASQTLLPMTPLVDSGDHQTFTSGADLWSQRAGYTPVIRPNGLLTGGLISPSSNQDDQIDVAALTVQLQGLVLPVAGTVGIPLTRGIGTDTHIINSLTVNAAGTVNVLIGEEGTSFTEARGAAGGAPFIPVDSVEIGQIRLTETDSATVTLPEIFQKPGIHQERANFPGFTANPLLGELTFVAPLPLSHVGGLPKALYAEVYEPEFAEVDMASSFVPPETTHSVSSTQVYGRAVGASSSSLNQGSFKALLEDGVTDPLVLLKNEVLFFRFYPDQNKSAHLLCFGTLGLARQFPADNHIEGSFTVSAPYAAVERES